MTPQKNTLNRRRIIIIALAVLVLFNAAGCETESRTSGNQETVKVAATIFPLADIVKQVGGNTIEVVTVLPPGANPHTFELTPSEVKALHGVRLIFAVGAGLDDWLAPLDESLPNAERKTVADGIKLLGGERPDPHYWLSFANARVIAGNVAARLKQTFPAQQDVFDENLSRYLTLLAQADQEIDQIFSNARGKPFVTFHGAWQYLADAYGLELIGTIEGAEGTRSSPKHLAELAARLEDMSVRTFFLEAQMPETVARSLAEDYHLRIHRLDPLGDAFGSESYIDMMLENAKRIAEALSNG